MKKFILFCLPRTGSSTLTDFLRDLGLSVSFEPFRPSKWIGREMQIEWTLGNVCKHMDGLKHLNTHTPEDNRRILDWCQAHGMQMVFLSRRDKAQAALSYLIAERTGRWLVHRNEDALDYSRVELDEIPLWELQAKTEEYARWEAGEMNAPGANWFFYEDLYEGDTPAELRRLMRVIKMEPPPHFEQMIAEHFTAHGKQNPRAFLERISNWAEIEAWMETTGT
ncbi:MAG: hypothetical protein DYG85_06355 [Chloroflexi bacterium CFX1]|nr:hypothetical protein [Chloroflexi bacterium CFX1]